MTTKEKPKSVITRKGSTKQYTFTGIDNKEWTINEKQKLFCESYADPFTSGIQAVVDAGYNVHSKKNKILNQNLARVMASENLMKPNICAYLSVLYDNEGLSDAGVDKQMSYNINQFKNLTAKNQAISEYNKVKGRHSPEKHEVKVTGVEIVDYSKAKKNDKNKTTS